MISFKAFLPLPCCCPCSWELRGAKKRLKERGVTVGFAFRFDIWGGGELGIAVLALGDVEVEVEAWQLVAEEGVESVVIVMVVGLR